MKSQKGHIVTQTELTTKHGFKVTIPPFYNCLPKMLKYCSQSMINKVSGKELLFVASDKKCQCSVLLLYDVTRTYILITTREIKGFCVRKRNKKRN